MNPIDSAARASSLRYPAAISMTFTSPAVCPAISSAVSGWQVNKRHWPSADRSTSKPATAAALFGSPTRL